MRSRPLGSKPRLATSEASLEELVAELEAEPRYALDTEFHRERTYFPKLALMQIAWSGGIAIVDPLAVDTGPLRRVFSGPKVAVLHAAEQDLELLEAACGVLPARVFDTQIAAGFLGIPAASLSALTERFCGVRLPKGDRLTDWLDRPLRQEQISYAAADVAHLLELADRISDELRDRGRIEWVAAECEELRVRDRSLPPPEEAWRRIKEVRHLRGQKLAVAQALATWREQRAIAADVPPRFVLPDMSVVAIANRLPSRASDLRKLRGVDPRYLKGGVEDEILRVVEEGMTADPRRPDAGERRELEARMRPAVSLISAWLAQVARDLEVDPALIATRAEIEALLRGDEGAKLGKSWRAELVGDGLRSLLDGEAAVAFDASGRLLLEPRAVPGSERDSEARGAG